MLPFVLCSPSIPCMKSNARRFSNRKDWSTLKTLSVYHTFHFLMNLTEFFQIFGPNKRPFVVHEVIDRGGEAVRCGDYLGIGRYSVCCFLATYCSHLTNVADIRTSTSELQSQQQQKDTPTGSGCLRFVKYYLRYLVFLKAAVEAWPWIRLRKLSRPRSAKLHRQSWQSKGWESICGGLSYFCL